MNVNDIIITSIETITGFDMSGDYLFTLDELQSATIAQTQDKEDITGKQGRKLSSLKKNKAATVSGTNGLVSGGLLEMQTGSKFEEENAAKVLWTEYLTVDTNSTVTLSHTPVGTTGAEIKGVYIKNSDGTVNKELTQAESAVEGTSFSYASATKKITFSGVAKDTEVVVMYDRQLKASVLANQSDTYSAKCQLYIDAIGEDKCANVFHLQFYFPKADFSGEFSMQFGDSQAVHEFEAEALSGACGVGGTMWTYTIFSENEEDAE